MHVSGSLELSTAQLSHAPSDAAKTHAPPHHYVNMPMSSVSCPSNDHPHQQRVLQPRQSSLHRLQLQPNHPVHQFLPPPSSSRPTGPAQSLPSTRLWSAYPEHFPSGSLSQVHEYHQSAPEHLNVTKAFPPKGNKGIDAQLQAYVSRPAAVNGLPHQGELPALSAAAASSEMHLARLTLDSLPDPVDAAAAHSWQQYPVPVHAQTSVMPPHSMSPQKSPDWCVVTGLMLAPGHARAPENVGVVSVTTMLLWPPGIRSALQSGQLCLTLDAKHLECRGSACLPSLMFCCPHADMDTAMATVKGVITLALLG